MERPAAKLWLWDGHCKVQSQGTLVHGGWGEHPASQGRQATPRSQVQQDVMCVTYESTESAFPSCHSSQTEDIPQDGQAHCSHPQGIERTGVRDTGGYRPGCTAATNRQASKSGHGQSCKWVSLSSPHLPPSSLSSPKLSEGTEHWRQSTWPWRTPEQLTPHTGLATQSLPVINTQRERVSSFIRSASNFGQ